ncbi:hypothetical protein BN871_BG_00400 [Paenibacillus sp. P22]|nr:hypothetical protein BN871_BG_00400 [Paenibacillus sp. P22]
MKKKPYYLLEMICLSLLQGRLTVKIKAKWVYERGKPCSDW